MLGFITDDNNDLMLDKWGDLRIESGIESYRQHLLNRCRLQQYEYPYDLTRGINYLGYILGDRPNLVMWESQILGIVNATPFVKSIVDWKYNIDGKNFLFSLTVDTDRGQIAIRG